MRRHYRNQNACANCRHFRLAEYAHLEPDYACELHPTLDIVPTGICDDHEKPESKIEKGNSDV